MRDSMLSPARRGLALAWSAGLLSAWALSTGALSAGALSAGALSAGLPPPVAWSSDILPSSSRRLFLRHLFNTAPPVSQSPAPGPRPSYQPRAGSGEHRPTGRRGLSRSEGHAGFAAAVAPNHRSHRAVSAREVSRQ